MPDQATIQTNPQAAELSPRGGAASSAQRAGSAAEAQTGSRGHTARPLAAGFAAVFASALQDNAKGPTPMHGDKPVAGVAALGEGLNQPVNALALALTGNIDGAPTLKTTAQTGAPDGVPSVDSTAQGEDRPKHLKPAFAKAASERPDASPQDTVAASVTCLPTPPPQTTKRASPDFSAAATFDDSTPLAAKLGHVPHDPLIVSPATDIRASDSGDLLEKLSTLGQPVLASSLERIDTVAQPLALSVPLAPSFSLGAPVQAPRLQAPGSVSSTGSPADQVAPAVIRLSSADGARHISLQLTPTDLGLVDIRIEQPKDGPITITLTVQHPRTLDLLQRDLEQLSQTLDRAGLSSEGRQVSLHLAPAHTPAASSHPASSATPPAAGGMADQGSGQGAGPHANPNADMGQHSRSRGGPDFTLAAPQPANASPPSVFISYQTDHRAGLNITA